MALEGKVLGGVLHIRDRAPALNGANSIACSVREAREAARLHLQRRLALLVGCWVLLDTLQIVNQQVPLGTAHDQQGPLHVHGVDALGQLQCGNRRGLLRVPEAQRLVPATGDHHVHVVNHKDLLDWGVVLPYLLLLLRLQYLHFDLVVCTAAHEPLPVAREAATQDRGFVLIGHPRGDARRADLPDPHALVPRTCSQDILRWRPSEATDTIGGWLRHRCARVGVELA
mmetsp:Transcript_5853/g.13858  ORF Transcript_5853/g.13858 Transcript_5853/m.13858 type:complete len:228 (+) Transcript_5853:414-1097(+)